jgi:hypothetical protein
MVMVIAVGIVTSLAWAALKPINQKNGFERKFSDVKLEKLVSFTKDEKISDVLEITGNRIYFTTKEPDKLFVTNDSLLKGYTTHLPFPNNEWNNPNFYTFLDSPAIVQVTREKPVIMFCTLNTFNSSIQRIPKMFFSRVVLINPNTFVFRGFDPSVKGDPIFKKLNSINNEVILERGISERNNDAGITSDGYLNYDKTTNSIIYSYIYSNKFIVLDTNLMLKYTSKTIDTISVPTIRTGAIGNGYLSNTGPSRVVNEFVTVSNGIIYYLSKLKADNEEEEILTDNTPVELYEITSGKYLHSFYIPKFNDEQVKSFKIRGNKMVAMYKSNVVLYKII